MSYTRTLRFNHNPLNLFLKTERKKGLRIGYMEAALEGFYLNSIETGMHPQKLSDLLLEKFYCNDTESVTGLFQFLHQRRRQDLLPNHASLPAFSKQHT